MKYAVVLTRSEGFRLSRQEIEAQTPLVGDLVITDLPASSNSLRRHLRAAYLKQPGSSSSNYAADVLPPIFDPEIVKMTESSMLLVGTALLAREDGKIREVMQGWLCRHVDSEST